MITVLVSNTRNQTYSRADLNEQLDDGCYYYHYSSNQKLGELDDGCNYDIIILLNINHHDHPIN